MFVVCLPSLNLRVVLSQISKVGLEVLIKIRILTAPDLNLVV